MKRNMKRSMISIVPGLAVILLWQCTVNLYPKLEFFVGSPLGIVREVPILAEDGALIRDIGITALEALIGFISGTCVGTLVGLTLWLSRWTYLAARPYLMVLGSVPAFALGPILIFWFGTGIWSKIVIGFLSTFVVAVVQAYSGASDANANLLRLTWAFGGGRLAQLLNVVAPTSLIWVLAGIRLNIGMALLGAFVGEFLASKSGLGHLIIVGEGLYNVNQIWVGVSGIVFIAMVFSTFSVPVEIWANRWKRVSSTSRA